MCVCIRSLSALNFAVSCLDPAGSCIYVTHLLLDSFLTYQTYLNLLWMYDKNMCNWIILFIC